MHPVRHSLLPCLPACLLPALPDKLIHQALVRRDVREQTLEPFDDRLAPLQDQGLTILSCYEPIPGFQAQRLTQGRRDDQSILCTNR